MDPPLHLSVLLPQIECDPHITYDESTSVVIKRPTHTWKANKVLDFDAGHRSHLAGAGRESEWLLANT